MNNESEIIVPFHGGTLTVAKSVAVNAWLDKVMAKDIRPGRDVPLIGAPWPAQGGNNGGLARDMNGKPYWLIVPPADVSSFEDIWGGYGVDEPGATSEFDGLANTIALCESSTDHPAAQRCRELVIDGHCDLYIPAKRELAVLHATVPELFPKKWHVSSTQFSASGAWGQTFDDGGQHTADKDGKAWFRAVRRLDF